MRGGNALEETIQNLIVQYGYGALFALLAFGIVGVPVPDEFLMTFVGYSVSLDIFSFSGAMSVSFAGAMAGMIVSYFLGRKVGKPFLWRYGRWVKLTPARLDKAETWFRQYGLWTVTFGYFVPGVRHFSCYLAGVSGVKFWRYLLYAGSGAAVWCATFITLGRFIGNNIGPFLHTVHHYMREGAIVLALLAVLTVVAVLRLRRKKQI